MWHQIRCIRKNRAITWKERTLGIALIAGEWVRVSNSGLTLNMQKKLSPWSKKGGISKKERSRKAAKSFLGGGKLARSLHHGCGEYLLGAMLLRMAWFQWGFLCCLCFGCGLTGSWERMEKGILRERIGKYQLHEFHDSSRPLSTYHPC